ncbi:MAG: T9SS type A sorting domain-containing protein [Ignavibacteria bacterium]|nr:T9SS type A sorting domain-containing protein [Ignavibacteria bacterium]
MRAKIIPYLFLFIFLSTVFSSYSQPSRDSLAPMWNTIPVPNPSHIRVITFDSSDVMYIGIWGEGIFRSLNLGQNWTEMNNGLTNKYITAIERDSNGILYASTYGGGIFISTNNGALWSPINNGLPSLKVKALKIKYPDICYAAIEGYGVYKITNRGATKIRLTKGLWNYDVNCITIGDNGSIVIGTNGDGIYYSDDGGINWRRSGYGNNFKVITSFAKSGLGEIFCGTYQGGVFSSADHGLTWAVFKRNDTLKNVTAVTYYNNAEPIAGTDRIGVLRYDSRAYEDWRLTNLRDVGIIAMGRSRQGILFAATIDGALYKSTNGGANWEAIRSPNNYIIAFHSFNNVLFVALNNNKSYKSTNLGLSWNELNTPQFAITAFYNDSSNRLFATAKSLGSPRGYLLVSTDLGENWDTVLAKNDTLFGVFANKNNIYFVAISFQPANPRDPASPRNDLLRSTDGGTTWNSLGVRSLSVQGICAIGFNYTGTLFVSLTDSVIKSTNNGNTWSIAINKSANNYRDIAFTRNGTVFVAGDFAILRSTNDGGSWSTKGVSGLYQYIRSLTATVYDQIIFTTYFGEMQTTINNGVTWDSTSIKLGHLKENILFIKSDKNGYIWLVTGTNIYRAIDPYALSIPNLLEPKNNALGVELSPTFLWNNIAHGDIFEMELSDEMDFNTVKERIILRDTSRQNYYPLTYNTLYFWRVRAKLNNALGRWSPAFAFTTIVEPPTLISPKNNQGALSLRPTFVWSKVKDATGYILQVSKSPNFNNVLFEKTLNKISDTTYTHNVNFEFATDYYWRVSAKVGSAQSSWSEVWRFRTKVQPVKLRLPPNTTYGVPISTKLEWSPSNGASTYEVQIALDENFENKFFDGISQASDYFEPKLLEYFTKYYWRIRASDEFGPTDWSEAWWFITIIKAPTLIAPANDSKSLKLPIVFQWENFEKASYHHIQIAKDKNFKQIVFEDSTLTKPSLKISSLEPNAKYYWRVRYIANNYIGLWSETFSFSTSIGQVTLIYPPNDTTNMPLFLTFQWEPLEGAEYYEFLLSKDPNFSQDIIFSNDQLTTTQLLVQSLSYSTTYYWKVRGKVQQLYGDWSPTWKFTTKNAPQFVDNEFVEKISIFPNPSNGTVYITLPESINKVTIKVTNILGKTILQLNKIENFTEPLRLNLTNLEKGIFFIIFEIEGKYYIKSFIKTE